MSSGSLDLARTQATTISLVTACQRAPGSVSPLKVQFAPDGSFVSYLYPEENTGKLKLYATDVRSPTEKKDMLACAKQIGAAVHQEGALSAQEQLRRERMRLFVSGLSTYEWAKFPTYRSGKARMRMLIPTSSELIIYEHPLNDRDGLADSNADEADDHDVDADGATYFVISGDPSVNEAIDPHISPNGSLVAFVHNEDLYVVDVDDYYSQLQCTAIGTPTPLGLRISYHGCAMDAAAL